jgi:hypothetical protein
MYWIFVPFIASLSCTLHGMYLYVSVYALCTSTVSLESRWDRPGKMNALGPWSGQASPAAATPAWNWIGQGSKYWQLEFQIDYIYIYIYIQVCIPPVKRQIRYHSDAENILASCGNNISNNSLNNSCCKREQQERATLSKLRTQSRGQIRSEYKNSSFQKL